MSKTIFVIIICFLQGFEGLSQRHLTTPLDKAVYQRNNDNVGLIPVSFSELYNKYDSIHVSLEGSANHDFSKESLGISIKQHTNEIDTFIVAKGGWYILKVDYFSGKSIVKSEEVSHVGIGEIFIVAGQSNVEINGPLAKDERVVGLYLGHVYKDNPTFISIVESKYEKLIWPSPPGVAFLGVLGDSLVKKLNVPVLFFNAAAGGSNSSDWFESSRSGELPYIKLNWIIDRFVREHGVRGVLWHQGEHNSLSYGYNPTKEVYRDEILGVINKSRSYLNFDKLSWVIAQVSWIKTLTDGQNDPNALEYRTPTREGQKLLTEADEHIFLGPDSDSIEGYAGSENRPDGTHFSFVGQALHAQLWNEVLNEEYFSSSQPYFQHLGIDVQIACDSYVWVNGETYSSSNYNATYLNPDSENNDAQSLFLHLGYSTSSIDVQKTEKSYTWINGKTYNESNFSDFYTITNKEGCDSVITLNLSINKRLALKNELQAVLLFPNPASDQLQIKLKEELLTSTPFVIIDSNGKTWKTWSSTLKNQITDISKLPVGTYLLIAKTRKQVLTSKFLKLE